MQIPHDENKNIIMRRLFSEKILIFFPILVITFFLLGDTIPQPPATNYNQIKGYFPKEGFVPDKNTAIKIAEAVWFPIYGESIYTKKPYKIKLIKGVWIIEGSLPKGYLGGVPYIEIQKKDGKILKVMHGK